MFEVERLDVFFFLEFLLFVFLLDEELELLEEDELEDLELQLRLVNVL